MLVMSAIMRARVKLNGKKVSSSVVRSSSLSWP